MTPKELARFEKYVDKGVGCWLWTGGTKGGYGRFRAGSQKDGTRRIVRAPRHYYEHFHGAIPKGLLLIHNCGNRLCVCPNHMMVGTWKDISTVKSVRGTHRTGNHKGERNPRAKLSDRQALDILWLHQDLNNKQVAALYGVHHSAISLLRLGGTFQHLPRPEGTVKYGTITGDPEPVINLHKLGYGYRRISKMLDIPKSTVQRYVSHYRLQSANESPISNP